MHSKGSTTRFQLNRYSYCWSRLHSRLSSTGAMPAASTGVARPAYAPRPRLALGQYYVSRPRPTRIRCKAYDQPPKDGRLITTIEPATYLGPVENFIHSQTFATICVRGYWINVWCQGVAYADCEDAAEVLRWKARGWYEP